MTCLAPSLPGKDCFSTATYQMTAYGQALQEAFDRETEGSNAEEPRDRAQWARMMADAIYRYGLARSKEVAQASGEALPPKEETRIHDTLAVPDLATVEASFERSRLLGEREADVAAMGIDASHAIQGANSLEKMLAHQLAATHKVVMEQLGAVSRGCRGDVALQAKRLNATTRGMTAYQNGLLTLRKLHQNGTQRITVQYVNVSDGGQAVIGDVERNKH